MNNLKRTLVLLVYFFCIHNHYSQVEVVIENKEDDYMSGFYFSWSLDSNTAHYVNNLFEESPKDNKIKKEFTKLDTIYGIGIESKNLYQLLDYVIVEPNDKLKYVIHKDSIEYFFNNIKYDVLIKNKNLNYFDNRLNELKLYAGSLDNLKNWFSKEKRKDDSILTNKYKKLKKSDTYINTVLLCSEMGWLFYNRLQINILKHDTKISPQKKENLAKFLLYLFETYDPFEPKYKLSSPHSKYTLVKEKCNLIQEKKLKGKYNDINLWNTSVTKMYNYAPTFLQKKLMENLILEYSNSKVMNLDELELHFDSYCKVFKEDIVMQHFLRKKLNETKDLYNNSEKCEYSFWSYENDILKKIETKNVDFTKLIKEKFPDKYVFIDVWATWCITCVDNFKYNDKIKPFLSNLGIETLYITIDDKSKSALWKDMIEKKKLSGYHYYGTPSITNSILKILKEKTTNMYIPRYILIGKNGEVVLSSISFPNEEKFYTEISEALKK